MTALYCWCLICIVSCKYLFDNLSHPSWHLTKMTSWAGANSGESLEQKTILEKRQIHVRKRNLPWAIFIKHLPLWEVNTIKKKEKKHTGLDSQNELLQKVNSMICSQSNTATHPVTWHLMLRLVSGFQLFQNCKWCFLFFCPIRQK